MKQLVRSFDEVKEKRNIHGSITEMKHVFIFTYAPATAIEHTF
jgi:hypothetical protein